MNRDDEIPDGERDRDRDRDHERYRSRDHEIGPPKKTTGKSILGLVIGLSVAYLLIAYNNGLFPFQGVTGVRGTIKQIIVEQLHIPVEKVEMGPGDTATGILASGERLKIHWKREGDMIRCICQKPLAAAEQDIREMLTQLQYEPKTITIRSSENGIGYVGEATVASGETFNVTETTSLSNFQAMQYVKVAPTSYPILARNMLAREIKVPITGTAPSRPGDHPIPIANDNPLIQREVLFKGRFLTATQTYIVELLPDRGPGGMLPGVPGQPQDFMNFTIYYIEAKP